MEGHKGLNKNKSMLNEEYSGLDNSILTKDNKRKLY
jgi:hypothetical protein